MTKFPREVLVLRHVEHVPIAALAEVFAQRGVAWRYVDLFKRVPRCLPLETSAGLVILGGPMSAYQVEQFPFLAAELPWIREAIDLGLPTLGLCLGAQLMARALGQSVHANLRKEIGFYALDLLPAAGEDELLAGSQAVETVFQWHGDTFDLPDGAVWLARSAACANQAFRIGSRAWALQFHAEMTAALIDEWLAEPGFACEIAGLDYIDPRRIRDDLATRLAAMETFCRRVLGRFAGLCAEEAWRM